MTTEAEIMALAERIRDRAYRGERCCVCDAPAPRWRMLPGWRPLCDTHAADLPGVGGDIGVDISS